MKQLTVRCEETMAAAISDRAAARGESVNDYLLGLAREDLSYPTIVEWIDDVETLPTADWDGHAADLIRVDRESR